MSPPDILVVSIAIGILVSFVFSEVYGLAAGGVVVPGYIALYLDRPVALALTLGVALAAFAVTRGLSTFTIIYGRRRTAVMILVGFALGAWLSRFEPLTEWLSASDPQAGVIGYIIPGLIAIWFDRQGITPTLASLTVASVLVRLALLLFVTPHVLHEALS
ncbi:MAG: poly-gamma-glutamate biosynthesis protein PgsC [Sandaracinaceae bacterium]